MTVKQFAGIQSMMNRAALTETTLLAGTAAMLLVKALNGELSFYIHPKYAPLVVIGAIVLLLIAGARAPGIFRSPSESLHPSTGRYLILAIPLLLAALVPAQPLGASSFPNTTLGGGLSLGASNPAGEDTRQWNLLQWTSTLSTQGSSLIGREADLTGFVYRDPQRPFSGFFVARYVVVHCVVDSRGVSLPVVWKDGSALPIDTWVRIRGTIGTVTIGDRTEPALLATSVEPMQRPDHPYLYP